MPPQQQAPSRGEEVAKAVEDAARIPGMIITRGVSMALSLIGIIVRLPANAASGIGAKIDARLKRGRAQRQASSAGRSADRSAGRSAGRSRPGPSRGARPGRAMSAGRSKGPSLSAGRSKGPGISFGGGRGRGKR